MSERKRFPFNTAGLISCGILITLIITSAVSLRTLSALLDRDHERSYTPVTDAQTTEQERHCLDLPTPENKIECVRAVNDSERTAKHDQADLHAQQDVAALTVGIFWFAALGFVTSGIGVVLLIWTFNEQRKLTRLESRSYVGIEDTELPEINAVDPFMCRITLRNGGGSPALDMQVVWGTVGQIEGEPDPFPNEAAIDKMAESTKDTMIKASLLHDGKLSIAPRRNPMGAPAFAMFQAGKVTLYVVGRITYRDDFSGEEHRTYFKMAHGGIYPALPHQLSVCKECNVMT